MASGKVLEDAAVTKIQSAVRWNKSGEEIMVLLSQMDVSLADALAAEDSKTGNRCLHVAAQNGHQGLVKYMLEGKANVNAQNGKGQTALHMSVEYDFYFQSVALLEGGAEATITNAEGHGALSGIDGGKEGKDAWDNPVTILKAAGENAEQLNLAFKKLEEADPATIDKATLAQAGMAKKRACKECWDAPRFMALMKRF